MKRLWIILPGLLFAACDYDVALVNALDVEIDNALVGSWNGVDEGEGLLVLPLGEREYLVSYPAGAPDAMFARGRVWRDAGLTLVQLDWFGNASGEINDGARYQYATYAIDENALRIRLLNTSVVSKDLMSPDALAKRIHENKDHADLFRDEMVFEKASP